MLRALLKEYEDITELNGDSLSYKSHSFTQLYEILPDAFNIRPALSRTEAIRLFSKALRNCRLAGEMGPDALATEAISIQRQALSIPNSKFTLYTKFRALGMGDNPAFKLKWQNTKIRSASKLPRWLRQERYFLNGVGRIDPNHPHSYGHIILECEDRTEERAVDRLTDALQITLGIMNMYETWGRYTLWGNRKWTEGCLWPGPNHFVFNKRKFICTDKVWYNPDYDEEAWNRSPPKMDRILQILPHTRKALKALESHPLRDFLTRSIMLFQDGLTTQDGSRRLLRYWSALEQLYVERDSKSNSNEKVISRCLFDNPNPSLTRWKLTHISKLRNDYVHAGGADGDTHDLCQFLRRIVAAHINYWIFNGQSIENQDALFEFVDLPRNREILKRRRSLIDRRLAALEKWQEG